MDKDKVLLEETYVYYKKHGDLLSFIKKAHEIYGYLTPENIKNIASLWRAPVGEVYGLITFYSFFSTKPLGQSMVRVCKSTPCYFKNYQTVIETLAEEFNLKPGGMTEDRKISLQLVNCIGTCDHAPAMMVDSKVYGNLTPKKVCTILKRLIPSL